ncbi:MAG: ESPR-type extended signal peptide-containing protein [Veillonella sp.]|uniref:ESPR-type extended signal peptide-containing protein n=1 Tax=Veillonella sp. TaxID=1926307 RepID=UPI0028FF5B47|nr:YadA-like family protein [Veillonella sp.]MDU0851654.1 ESPR-type extended signal peptide-containing protein [Veillonella sp.]MDU1501758.1 ESPR-type extended signal peptide-containing protein [Veillonella sp.]MDU1657545.1 ESPR-type extended signal peptide-containing protein [Veillonella sp.]
MNRIYNVIWSKTKKCYVVVSEIVKSGGGKVKSLHTGKTHARMGAVMAVAALLAGVNITSVNAAAIIIDDVNNSGYATGQTGGTSWSYLYNYGNPGNKKALDRSASTGYYSKNPLTGVAIGHNTKIQETQDNTYYSGVAIGDYAQATGGLAFALGNYAQSTKPSAMALGTASLSSGFNSLAMMRQSAATGNFSTAIGTTSWAKGTGSFAMGYSAQAYGDQSIAIGAAEPITVAGSGTEPSASYNGDTNTVTNGARSLAFGTKARTSAAAIDSMAFGSNSITDGANAVAVGNSANAAATDAFAFGNTAQATGANAIAMGRTAQAKELNAIALGGQAKALEANALAIGGTAEASKAGTMAIGTAAKASSNNATAIGNGAEVTGENSMALGSGAKISSNNSIALGAGTEFNDPLVNTYAAFTNEINPAEAGVVAVGNTSTPRRIVNVAGGQNDNDAATIKQLRYVNNNLAMTIAGPTYTGYEANGSTYKAPDFSIKNSTYHTVKEAVEAAQTNFFSAKGTSADANYDNKGATGTNATAAGVRASAAGNFGTALGADATATSEKGTALGYNAKVTEDDGVALGSNSVANTEAGVAGYDVSAADNRANKYTALTGNVATSTLGAVSVGQSTSVGNETRQITNLAAGKKDTDAVNVAQLRNVNLKIAGNTNDNNGKNDVLLDKQTLTVKGDGTYVTTKANNQTIDVTLTNDTKDKIDNAANKDLSNITNVGKKNITALGTIVEAGHNVTIPAATVDTTTGQKTYTVNAMDTKVSLGTSGLMTLTGGTPDANGVRNYTVDVDPTKVAKTDLSNINNDGKTVIREEAQKAVKVIAGQNTTVTEGTDGTYKTYAVNVAAAGDYRLVENSAAADKAYTVTGNKVDLTVQDGSTPANTKTVTIKNIASKTELDQLNDRAVKYDVDGSGNVDKSKVTYEGPTYSSTNKSGGTHVTNVAYATGNDGSEAVNVDYLTDKITDTKTELINKGLKFNADNNDVKTNKLGSTVTVSGDANITTKITKTGDDSTIAVALNKDLNVKTVTATDTVKAGTTTAGNQTATDNKGGTQTGNFITGLDNTAWNMADPVFVSGRAATEDQLKTVSDAVRAANAGSSDYRLIGDPANTTDGSYKVTNNQVDLKVKDDKSGTTNTVTIKDIASKTEFDKLNDRAVKYDVDGSGNVDKSKVTYEGPTYSSTNKSGGTHVTNVAYATGNDGSEAVNVDYLTDKINDSSEALINKGMKFDANVGGVKTNKLGSTVKVQGEGTEADTNYSGKNIKTFIGQDSSGNTTIDVKMNKNLEVETVTATGANGKDGKIGINGKDGVTTNLSITRDGQPGVDGAAGTTTTRIVYEKPDGTKEEVATLNDGLKFKGDMGATSNVKLNKQVDVTGGVTNAADLATGNNIGVTSAVVDANGNAKLQLQLAKDITGLKSVTATDTVKAGTATVGNQTATDNKGGTQTGNFVTGLDNTNWNMTDPVFVPGRAATEDQLKTVSDAVKAASASASDYRLIGDPANTTDGSYKVTNNQVDLKVKDDKSGTTNTVTIKDIVSKTELDKLDDRAVKYDLDPTTNTADKSKVTYEGPAYTNKTGGTHVTNVAYATGNDGSEAVNVDYLTDKIKDSSDALINKGLKFDANIGGVQTNKLGSTVLVKGEGNEADANYSGENIKTFIKQDNTTGNTTIDIKLNKNLVADSIKVNKDGRDGKDGVSITGPTGVAGQDGNNGKVGITGADGKDAVSISGKDGVGHIGLTGPAGTNGKDGSNGIDMSVKNGYDDAAKGVKGEKGVDGVDGITRIVYTDNTGEHQVATMDDGMLYGGDAGNVIKKKLNNQVNVKGGITDETKLTADDNIGVVSDGTDTLKVRLAKDLKGLNTVTAAETVKAGTATVGNQEATKADGTKETGNYVTGLDNKTWDADNIVTGRAATEDQLKDALANQSNAGLKFDANVGGTKTNKLGSTVIVKGEGTDADANYSGENIKTFIDQDNTTGTTTINVKLNKNLVADSIKVNKDGKDGKDGVSITGPTGVAGQDGNNGKVGITGADGKDAVSISGKDGVGHIGLTGPAGTNGKDGSNGIDMSVKNGYEDDTKGVKGEKGVDGIDGITRIVYTDKTGEHQVATMDDGMLYGGDSGTVIKKKLNNQVNVKGGITDAAKLSNEDNIGVVVDGTDTLMLRLAKDLKGLNSATFNNGTDGNTVVNGGGLTIKDGANEATKLTKDGLQINDGGNKAVTIDKDGLTIENGPKVTKDGINAGDKKITNVEDGTITAGSKDAVNGGQLHTAMEDIKAQGFGLKAEDGQFVKKPLGEVIDLKGDGNIKTSVDGTAIKMSLNDTITLGTDPAKQVKVDGSTGTITAGNGANQVTIDGSTGSVTAGNTVKAGDVIMGNQSSGGQNGNFVTGLDNKTWNPNNPVAVTGRAATEDQLKAVNDDFNEKAKNGRVFQGDQAGNDGKVVRGLGDTMNLKGGADVNRLSDNNLAVVKNTAGDGYDIKLAKDLNLKDGSTTYTKTVPGTNTTIPYTVDTKVDGGGITITPSINGQPVPGHTVSLTENGLNNGNNTITNVAPGINGTDAVNVNQLRNAMHSVDGKIADVGAASAAMAGLKPLQYDPLEPTQVLAAVGNYKGSTAAAIGIAHYTNESTMLHMGVSLGGHDNMVNAGVSYKFGTSDAKKAIPARYKAGPISSAYVMQDEVAALKAENLRMKQRDEELSAKYEQVQRDNDEMKAQIAMLMKQAGLTK